MNPVERFIGRPIFWSLIGAAYGGAAGAWFWRDAPVVGVVCAAAMFVAFTIANLLRRAA